ncbi:hypothetical protein L7F22_033632 [Adiantum nelumboides]|nr:hypothetical protein [Adiantum nelumboides]
MGDAMKADGAFIGQDVFVVTPLIGKLRLHIQGYVDKEDFFISPLKQEDVILGDPWFDHLAASIKFPERKISFKFREKDMYINAQESGTIPLVNDQAFDKSIKSFVSAYMIFVKDSLNGVDETQVNENGMQVDLELSNFLNQFQDVFIDDIPRELPPKRGDDDHMIEFIPGSSPPNKPPYRILQVQQEEIMKQVNELVEKEMMMVSPPLPTTSMQRVKQGQKSIPSWAMHINSMSTGDECEEYVSLSQENGNPLLNASYVKMIHEAMVTPSSKGKTGLQVERSPPCVAIEEPSLVRDANTLSPAQTIQTTQTRDRDTKGTKHQRATAITWDDKSTHTLFKVYKEQWTHIKKANFHPKDWEDLAFALNREINGDFNPEHCRNCIDTLKKLHKKEISKQNSTGATLSVWPFFELCDGLWGKTPKCVGIASALDNDGAISTFSAANTPIVLRSVYWVISSPPSTTHLLTFERMENLVFFLALMTLLHDRAPSLTTPTSTHSFNTLVNNNFFCLVSAYTWLCCGVAGALESEAWRYAPRVWWSFPRQYTFFGSVHSILWTEARLAGHDLYYFTYRMSRKSFDLLLREICPLLPIAGNSIVRDLIPP